MLGTRLSALLAAVSTVCGKFVGLWLELAVNKGVGRQIVWWGEIHGGLPAVRHGDNTQFRRLRLSEALVAANPPVLAVFLAAL